VLATETQRILLPWSPIGGIGYRKPENIAALIANRGDWLPKPEENHLARSPIRGIGYRNPVKITWLGRQLGGLATENRRKSPGSVAN